VSEKAASSSEAASALQVWASELRRFVEQARAEDAEEGLELLSDLLLEVAVLMERSERRWLRLAFDLHDGALQEIAALRMEVQAFRSGLRKPPVDETSSLDRLAEFTDELDARLQKIDSGLRELVESFETPALADQPFEESVRGFVREFVSDTDITTSVDLRGDFQSLTRSQRITLFRILVEALTNVRQHSGADRAWVSLRVQGGRARLRVRDNGKGFDVKRTPRRAAQRGRRGMLGMAERVRLLGGQFDVGSQPGGPTTITATIPAGRVDELQPTLERRAKAEAKRRAKRRAKKAVRQR
jgi:signal transduction histidine kinase